MVLHKSIYSWIFSSQADPLSSTSSAGAQEDSDDEYAWAKFISDDESDEESEDER